MTGADDHETTPPLNVSGSNSSGDSGRSGGGVSNSESLLLGSDRVVIDHRRQSEEIRHREVMDGWMDGWMNEWMDGWMNIWMDGWMDEYIDGWMDGWMDG